MPRKTAEPAKTGAQKGPNTGQVSEKQGSTSGVAAAKTAPKQAPAGTRRRAAAAKKSAGDLLRDELSHDKDPVGIRMLIRQASRVADRLEAIDALLKGDADAWLTVSLPRSDAKRGRVMVEVQVDGLVKEERAQSVLFRSLIADIYKQRAGLGGDNDDDDDDLVE